METEVKIFLDSSDAISEQQLLDAAFIRDLADSARELENRLVAKKSYLKILRSNVFVFRFHFISKTL